MDKMKRGILCTLVGGTLWGFSGACGQFLFQYYHLNSLFLTSVRMTIAGMIIVIYGFFFFKDKMLEILKHKKDMLILLVFGIFGLGTCQFTYLQAINTSNAGTATVLQYLSPIYIMIFVCLTTKRIPTKKELFCIVLALGGTYVLATHGNPATMTLSSSGLFWGILSGMAAAAYALIPRRLMRLYGSVPVTGYGMLIGGIVMTLGFRSWQLATPLDTRGMLAMGAIILLGTVLAFNLYLQGVNDIGAIKASMLASVEPVSAACFAFFWLHTSFQIIDLIGFGMIMTTVFLLSRPSQKTADA